MVEMRLIAFNSSEVLNRKRRKAPPSFAKRPCSPEQLVGMNAVVAILGPYMVNGEDAMTAPFSLFDAACCCLTAPLQFREQRSQHIGSTKEHSCAPFAYCLRVVRVHLRSAHWNTSHAPIAIKNKHSLQPYHTCSVLI